MMPRIAASFLLVSVLLSGCASIVQKASDRLASQLGSAVLDSEDPATVRDGLPAYLLLLDGLVRDTPDKPGSASTLYAAANLNSAYAGNFTGEDADRARRLAAKALAYARRGACAEDAAVCASLDGDIDGFERAVAAVPAGRVAGLYALAAAWAGYLQANSSDWGAIADLPKVEILLNRVVAIDPGHAQGLPHVYLGVLHSLRPEAVGGKPDLGRRHFEEAIARSGDRNLYAKTLMAEYYARLLFDRDLHDRLLNEVIVADPKQPGFTLMNVLAQQRARRLLESGNDYF